MPDADVCDACAVDGIARHTLTSGSTTDTPSGTVLEIDISDSDANEITYLRDLATSDTDTYISLTEDAIRDMHSNKLSPILSTQAKQVTTFTEDLKNPTLVQYDLNLSARQLTLIFDETVESSFLDVNEIMFASSDYDANYDVLGSGEGTTGEIYHTLRSSTGTKTTSDDSTNIVVDPATKTSTTLRCFHPLQPRPLAMILSFSSPH
jgi:hypothetical protein